MTTEAMKMLNVIKAPTAGTIKRILIQKGDELSPGDLIMEIQPG
jgi:biotin carboxyl carrier protein